MKVLYVTTISSTMVFFIDHIKMLVEEGHTVELACNLGEGKLPAYYLEHGFRIHNIPFSRLPLSKINLAAYRQLKELLKSEAYDLVHTHTPNASVIVRLACRGLHKKGLKVFYTAHGFHFYKGAPVANWLIYYPVEKVCSRWTDTLITINREDYEFAKKHMYARNTAIIPGVGVDLTRFTEAEVDREAIHRDFGIKQDTKVLIYIAELNQNKNQTSLLDMLAELGKTHPKVVLLLVGPGEMRKELKEKAKSLGIEDSIIFTGFRRDIPQLLKASDICVPSSIREGFGINIIEAMACGIPVAAYDNRGHRTIIEDNVNGFLVPQGDHVAMAKRVKELLEQPDLVEAVTATARERVEQYSVECAVAAMKQIYET